MGLRSSLSDMVRYAHYHIGSSEFENVTIVSQENLEMMHRSYNEEFGYGWRANIDDEFHGSTGGTPSALAGFLIGLKDEPHALIVLANTDNEDAVTQMAFTMLDPVLDLFVLTPISSTTTTTFISVTHFFRE